MFPPWHTKERELHFLFSAPLFPNILGFYKQKQSSINFKTYADLTPYVVGTVIGYANPPGFDDAAFTKNVSVTDAQNMKMLCNKRIDLVIIDKIIGRYILRTQLPRCIDSIEWMSPALEIKPQHLVISKKVENAEEMVEEFNRGLQLLREAGEIKRILMKHGFYTELLESQAIN